MNAPLPQLTPRQHQVLEALCAAIAANGYAPTVRELAAAVGLKSPSSVINALQALQSKGYIQRGESAQARALTVLAPTDTPHLNGAPQ